MNAEAKAIKDEEDNLAVRRKIAENKASSLKAYLSGAIQGERYSNSNTVISWRKSESVFVGTDIELPEAYITIKVTEAPDKKKLKEALKAGIEIEGCRIDTNLNIQIK